MFYKKENLVIEHENFIVKNWDALDVLSYELENVLCSN